MEKFDNLVNKLQLGAVPKDEFYGCMNRLKKNFDLDLDIDTLNFYGLPVCEDGEKVFLRTQQNSYKDETYCIVDIETNGNSPVKNQIIELGAIKYKNGEIVDRFETYVYADYIPQAIVRLTNIEQSDLANAPSLKKVLHDFKLFLADNVFVAHNVKFDYNFISTSLKTVGLEELLNRKLCTVDLARKTIDTEKHGLAHLRDFLEIDTGEHHRAYADALSAAKVLDACFRNIPEHVKTTEDLIAFSKHAPRAGTRKKKKAKTKTEEKKIS
ncbi:MAG: 3'-5' exonuclease [Sulfurospirillum sp.]|nr:MAG: 3'-5' exonuclease [Sulfurospirillum sp.]